jgi:hypothetical protein
MSRPVWIDSLKGALRFEYRRLISLRSTKIVLITLAAWTVIGGLSVGLQSRSPGERIDANTVVSGMTAAGQVSSVPIAAFLFALLATFSATDDWRTGQGVTTYLTTPRRGVSITAKCLTMTSFAIAYSAVTITVGLFLSVAIGGRPVTQAINAVVLTGLFVGHSIAVAFWCCAALSLGIILRSSAAVIACLLLAPLLGEILLAGALISAGADRVVVQLLPFRSAAKLLLPDKGAASLLVDVGVVTVVMFIMLSLAMKVLSRRDI